MPKLSAIAKSRVYSSLEKYARSGMGMEKACESLLSQPRIRAAERRVYRGMLEGLSRGKSIGDSLGLAGAVVSPLEVEVVSASEEGGMLEKGFGHLAEYFRRVDRTRRKIMKGLTYPIILVHLAVPVSTLAMTAFRSFSLDGNSDGPDFLAAFWNAGRAMLYAYAIIFLVIVGAVVLTRMGRTSATVDALLNRIPLVGKARRSVAMERFARVFEIFLLAGKKMSECLAGAGSASGSGMIRRASRLGAKTVASGQPLATAIYDYPATYPNEFARGVSAAEEAGALDKEMGEWGEFYSESAAEAMEQVAEWAPKLFYWSVLIFVAVLIVRSAVAYKDLLMKLLDTGY